MANARWIGDGAAHDVRMLPRLALLGCGVLALIAVEPDPRPEIAVCPVPADLVATLAHESEPVVVPAVPPVPPEAVAPIPEITPPPAIEPPVLPRDPSDDRIAVRRLVMEAARALAQDQGTALATLATPDAVLPPAIANLTLLQADEPRIDADHALCGGSAMAGEQRGRWHAGAVHTPDGWRLTTLAVNLDAAPVQAPPAPRPWSWLIAGGVLGVALGAVLGLTLMRRGRSSEHR